MTKTHKTVTKNRIFKTFMLAAFALATNSQPSLIQASEILINDNDKLVSIGWPVTETIIALGDKHRLVGVDKRSTFMKEGSDLTNIGAAATIDLAAIKKVNGQTVLALEGALNKDNLTSIESNKIPVLIIPDDHSEDGVIEKISFIGHALNHEDKVNELIARIKNDFDKANSIKAELTTKKKVLFLLTVPSGDKEVGPIFMAGKNTPANDIIVLSGGENAAANLESYVPLNKEQVTKMAPDLILSMSNDGFPTVETLLEQTSLQDTPAVKNKDLLRLDGLKLLGFGPDTGIIMQEIAQKLVDIQNR